MNSLAIETHGLGKRFGARAALESIDLEVPRGSAFGFLGRNGAGKTTLVRLLLGLAQPTSGTMKLLGHELPGGRAQALARVGASVEEPRVHIARCLLCDPELLILDEPVNELDPAGILEFRQLVRSLVAEGRTVLRRDRDQGRRRSRVVTTSRSRGASGAPRFKILVLTTFGLDEYIVEALRAGASGFLTKDVPRQELVAAVKAVSSAAADPSRGAQLQLRRGRRQRVGQRLRVRAGAERLGGADRLRERDRHDVVGDRPGVGLDDPEPTQRRRE